MKASFSLSQLNMNEHRTHGCVCDRRRINWIQKQERAVLCNRVLILTEIIQIKIHEYELNTKIQQNVTFYLQEQPTNSLLRCQQSDQGDVQVSGRSPSAFNLMHRLPNHLTIHGQNTACRKLVGLQVVNAITRLRHQSEHFAA